ncbi:MAG: hypothetical protein AAF402_11465 [Pseudomonadota bacterium]
MAAELERRGWKEARSGECADFAMWYPYDGNIQTARCELLASASVNMLDDKLSMHTLFARNKCESISPPTFFSLPDYLDYLKRTHSKVDCFLKLATGSANLGLYYFNAMSELLSTLKQLSVEKRNYVLQAAVDEPWIVLKRKFKVRVYVLLYSNWRAFVYKDCLTVFNEVSYEPGIKSLRAHASENTDGLTGRLSEIDGDGNVFEAISTAIMQSLNCLYRSHSAIPMDGSYQLFGFDFVCNSNRRPFLVDVNSFPNLERTGPQARPLIEAMMRDMFTLLIDPKIHNKRSVAGRFREIQIANL